MKTLILTLLLLQSPWRIYTPADLAEPHIKDDTARVTIYRRIIVTSPCAPSDARGVIEVYNTTYDWRNPTYIHPQLERHWGRRNILRRLHKIEHNYNNREAYKYIEAVSRSFKCSTNQQDMRVDSIKRLAREVNNLPEDAVNGDLIVYSGYYYARIMNNWVKLDIK